ncbi:hypothetical protein ACQ4M3_41270 [Leptolyngbya sp. AN03gr2]|uniref:hypothetical protein n=1 Tax=unclassified Leptolyngbya TaxID=2650499 RepID=UPI003D311C18
MDIATCGTNRQRMNVASKSIAQLDEQVISPIYMREKRAILMEATSTIGRGHGVITSLHTLALLI